MSSVMLDHRELFPQQGGAIRHVCRSRKIHVCSANAASSATERIAKGRSSKPHAKTLPENAGLDVERSPFEHTGTSTSAGHLSSHPPTVTQDANRLTGHVQINAQLLAADSLAGLLHAIDTYYRHFNNVNTTTAVMRLGKLLRYQSPATVASTKKDARVARLLSCVVKWAPECRPRQVMTILTSLAWFQPMHSGKALKAVAGQLEALVAECTPEDLCHAVWAFAKLGYKHTGFVSSLEQDALHRGWLEQIPPVSLSNLIWGIAKLRVQCPELVSASLTAIGSQRFIHVCEAQHVSMAVWSLASMRVDFSEVSLQLVDRTIRLQGALIPQAIANIAWGMSQCGGLQDPTPLVSALTVQARHQLNSFQPKELSNLMGALARLQADLDPQFTQDVLHHMGIHMRQFSAADLSEVLVALATLGVEVKEGMMEQMAVMCATKVSDLCPPQQLSLMLWSFAKLRHCPSPLLYAVDVAQQKGAMDFLDYSPKQIARVVWSLATFNHKAGAVMNAAADAFVHHLPHAEPQSVSMVVWSYATLGHAHHTMMEAVANHVCTHVHAFGPQGLANVLWGFAKLEIHPSRGVPGGGPQDEEGTPLLDAIAMEIQEKLHLFDATSLSMVLWSYSALEYHPGDDLMHTIARTVVTKGMHFSPKGLVALCRGYSQLGTYNKAVFDRVAQQLMRCDWLEHYPTSALANIAFAFAKAGDCRPKMMECVLRAAQQRLDHFSPPELINLMWAFGALGLPLPRDVLDCIARQLLRNVDEIHVSLLCLAIHCFASLQHHPGPMLGETGRLVIDTYGDISSSMLCTLMNAYAMLYYIPDDDVIDAVASELHLRMEGMMGNNRVLTARDTVQALWSLLLMDQFRHRCTALLALRVAQFPPQVPSDPRTLYMALQAVTLLKAHAPRLYSQVAANRPLMATLDDLAGGDSPKDLHRLVKCRQAQTSAEDRDYFEERAGRGMTTVGGAERAGPGLKLGLGLGLGSTGGSDAEELSGGLSGGVSVGPLGQALRGPRGARLELWAQQAVDSFGARATGTQAEMGTVAMSRPEKHPGNGAAPGLGGIQECGSEALVRELRGFIEGTAGCQAAVKKSVLGDWLVSFRYQGSKAVVVTWDEADVVQNSGGLMGPAVARYQVLEASGLLVFELCVSEWLACADEEEKGQLVEDLLLQNSDLEDDE